MKKGCVVYVSNAEIQVVKAEVKRDAIRIEDFFKVPLHEGIMLSGVIIDDYGLKEALKQVSEKGINEVYLIVDSPKILAKKASVPKMKESEVLQFVKDELSAVGNNADNNLVYDFAYLGEDETAKKASKILCVGVERKFIESYLEVFKEAGIEIKGIDYAINTLISLVEELPGFINKTFAITQIDAQNTTSVLFINNEYALTNRSRVFAGLGSEEYEREIGGLISQLKQFASSSTHEHPISDIYVFGHDKEKEESLFDNIYQSSNLIAKRLPSSKAIYAVNSKEFDVNEYAYCIGYLRRK